MILIHIGLDCPEFQMVCESKALRTQLQKHHNAVAIVLAGNVICVQSRHPDMFYSPSNVTLSSRLIFFYLFNSVLQVE